LYHECIKFKTLNIFWVGMFVRMFLIEFLTAFFLNFRIVRIFSPEKFTILLSKFRDGIFLIKYADFFPYPNFCSESSHRPGIMMTTWNDRLWFSNIKFFIWVILFLIFKLLGKNTHPHLNGTPCHKTLLKRKIGVLPLLPEDYVG